MSFFFIDVFQYEHGPILGRSQIQLFQYAGCLPLGDHLTFLNKDLPEIFREIVCIDDQYDQYSALHVSYIYLFIQKWIINIPLILTAKHGRPICLVQFRIQFESYRKVRIG